MTQEQLKEELRRKTNDIFEKGGGSLVVQAFTDAKKACADAGISDEEIAKIVYATTAGVER